MATNQRKLGPRQRFIRLCIMVLLYSNKAAIEPTAGNSRYVVIGEIEVHGKRPIYHHQTWKIEVWLGLKRVVAMDADGSISPYDKKAVAVITPHLEALVPLQTLAEIE